jgi:hypothetical protein
MAFIGVTLIVWLGAWSVPSFVFFGGALFLCPPDLYAGLALAYMRPVRLGA